MPNSASSKRLRLDVSDPQIASEIQAVREAEEAEIEGFQDDMWEQVSALDFVGAHSFEVADIPLELLVATAAALRSQHNSDAAAVTAAADLIRSCNEARAKAVEAHALYRSASKPIPFVEAITKITGDKNTTRAKKTLARLLAVEIGRSEPSKTSDSKSQIQKQIHMKLDHYEKTGLSEFRVTELQKLLLLAKK